MRVGLRMPLEHVDTTELKLDEYDRCPHCYCQACKCQDKRDRYARYSAADYAPYQQSEDDLIACIDLFNSLSEEDF
jgi:hypothetical protein